MLAEPTSDRFIHTCVRKQSARGLDGACHTIVATTPTARVALVVTFAGLASADNKVADTDAMVPACARHRMPLRASELSRLRHRPGTARALTPLAGAPLLGQSGQ